MPAGSSTMLVAATRRTRRSWSMSIATPRCRANSIYRAQIGSMAARRAVFSASIVWRAGTAAKSGQRSGR
jgi:hypothetical protein